MGDTILLRRGTAANLPALQEGEPGWCTDTETLYIGGAEGSINGAVRVGGYEIDALTYLPNTFTQATIQAALDAIATDEVTLLLRPGDWVILTALAFPANVTLKMAEGAYFSGAAVTAGTITIAGNKEVFPEWFNVTGTDDYVPMQAAASSLTSGGVLKLTGAYSNGNVTVNLLSNTWVKGDGVGKTIITGGMFTSTAKSNIKFSDFTMLNDAGIASGSIEFVSIKGGGSDITFDNIEMNGYDASVDWIVSRGIWTYGADNVRIRNCKFTDIVWPIYLDSNPTAAPGTYTTNVVIDGSTFGLEHFTYQYAANSYPAGVYIYNAKNVKVVNSTFKNFIPDPLDATADRLGYGVYDGDGSSDNLYVEGCTFENEYVATNDFMIGVNSFISPNVTVQGNRMISTGIVVYTPLGNAIVTNNKISDGGIYVLSAVGYTHTALISGNTVHSAPSYGIRVGQGGVPLHGVDYATVSGNIITESYRGGILIDTCGYATVYGNTILDANTSGSADAAKQSGIVFTGSYKGNVFGNKIANITSAGLAVYGIDFIANTGKFFYHNNIIEGMTSAPIANGYTAAPTSKTWFLGERVLNMTPAVGQPKAWVCTVPGTFSAATEAGTTTSGSPIVTAMADTSDFNVNELVDATAGFATLTALRVVSKTATTITVDRNANADGAATLATTDPTFVSEGDL